jgi:hypothetical protein
MRPTSILALAVLAMLVVDLVGCAACHFTVTGLPAVAGELGLLTAACVVYFRFRRDRRLEEMAAYVLLWLVFSIAAVILTYLCASWSFPLRDDALLAFDRALHFDLHRFGMALQSRRWLYVILRVAYVSFLLQITASVIWFAHTAAPLRNARLLSACMVSLVLTSIVSGLVPAFDPIPSENPAVSTLAVRDMMAMRAGGNVVRGLADLQGIIAFPSYHTVLAIVIAWAHRGLRTFRPAMLVNGVMLVSIPSVGNHYLTDMIGGLAVALVSIAATNAWVTARAANLPERVVHRGGPQGRPAKAKEVVLF